MNQRAWQFGTNEVTTGLQRDAVPSRDEYYAEVISGWHNLTEDEQQEAADLHDFETRVELDRIGQENGW
jgi:hypothetical protein